MSRGQSGGEEAGDAGQNAAQDYLDYCLKAAVSGISDHAKLLRHAIVMANGELLVLGLIDQQVTIAGHLAIVATLKTLYHSALEQHKIEICLTTPNSLCGKAFIAAPDGVYTLSSPLILTYKLPSE